MGDTKSQLTPITDKAKEMFGKIRAKKKTKASDEDTAEHFCTKLAALDEHLDRLTARKEADLKTEKGSEDKNLQSVALLRTMRQLLDGVIECAEEYSGAGKTN
jgi:hypothetical protein